MPGTQIAILLGVTKHAVYRRLRKFPDYKILQNNQRKEAKQRHSKIKNLHQKGYSGDDILEIVGLTRSALDSWRHRQGVYVPRQQEVTFDVEEAWQKFISGMSTKAIALSYGTYRIAISRALKGAHPAAYNRIAAKRKGGGKQGARIGNSWNVKRAYQEYEAGDSLVTLGSRYGKSPLTIRAGFVTHYGRAYRTKAKDRLTTHRSRYDRSKHVGWSEEKSLTILKFDGREMSIKDWAAHLGISVSAISWRRKKGWPIEMVLSPNQFKPGQS